MLHTASHFLGRCIFLSLGSQKLATVGVGRWVTFVRFLYDFIQQERDVRRESRLVLHCPRFDNVTRFQSSGRQTRKCTKIFRKEMNFEMKKKTKKCKNKLSL